MTDSNVSSSPATASDAQAAPKRARRQASTYPNNQNKPSNPFSKSAAKRGSVMALGSIEHLQHYFTKTGLATKRRSQQLNKNLVPALGPSVIPTLSVSSTPSLVFELPSPPLPPSPRPPFEEVERVPEAHPDILKPGVISDLEETERVWGLTQTRHDMATEEKQGPALLTVANIRKSSKDQFDVLSALQITTRAIRSVRNYLVALPDDETRLSVHNRHNDLTSSLRRHSQSRDRGKRTSDKSNKAARTEHPLTRIRKSALEVLETLRAIEETNRIPLSDEAYDNLSVGSAQGDMPLTMSDELAAASRSDTPYGGSSSAGRGGGSLFSGDEDDESTTSFAASQSPMVRHTVVPVNGTPKVIKVWSDDDDDDTFPVDEEKEKQPAWDQRMALNGGWLYTQVQLSSLEEPRAIIGKYLDIVDEILFGGPAVSSPPSRETSELGLQSVSSPISSTQRGWERVRATLPTPSKIRRASGRASIGTQSPTRSDPLSLSPKSTMKRVESSGLLSALKDMKVSPVLSDEPEEIKDDELGEVPEVDEEDLVEEIQDDELPQWARRDTFQDDLIGRLHAMLEENITADLRPWLPDFSGDQSKALGFR
ncbi:hypothetical protein FRC02_006684 [Tulasnella sp. 418]|nr:hypothetical protein FRC02_006684 [Tulasnella sp. 418]